MAELQQLDRGSVMPLHHQIGQRLLSQIQSGVYEAGQPLPPIQEIAASLGVSNMTVRQADKVALRPRCPLQQTGQGDIYFEA